MELRHLRYFVAIAEAGSFTLAAERLWVAQPGLSTQIRRLESQLGVRLFDRHTRGVDLTAAGELFLERARAVLAAAELAAATGRDIETGVVGTLRLGLFTAAKLGTTAEVIDAFAREYPQIEVTIVESNDGILVRDLRDGRLDALVAPSMFGSADLSGMRLGSEPWEVLVGRDHRLAGTGPLDADELRGENLVVSGHREGAGHDRVIAELLTELGVEPVLRRGRPGPSLVAAVAAGEAVALTTAPGPLEEELLARPLEPERTLRFDLFWRPEALSPALQKFIELAREHVARARPRTRPALAAVA
jgi:DNA-binding transcriptional LysR family regulator